MELRVLGPIEVRHDGSAVRVHGTKPRQLLALLAMRPNHPVAAEQLIDELWQGNPPASAATALRVHIARLRDVLELDRHVNTPSARLPAGPNGYVLRAEPDELDTQRFERLALLAREAIASGDPARAVPQLTAALDLWRGDALTDIADLAAARAEIARLDDLRAVAIEDLAEARLALGEHTLVVDLAHSALARYPLRERLTASLMRALYGSGRQAEALQAYADLSERLDAELGVRPSHDLRRLEEDILLQRPSLELRATRPQAQPSRARTPIGRFVGRRQELNALLQAVDTAGADGPRVVLVSGEAGIGKTTLIEELCARAEQFGPLIGHCSSESAASYEPVVELLRQLVETADPATRGSLPAQLGVVLPDLIDTVPDDDDVDGAQYRLFEAMVTTLRRLAPAPRVLIVEDLHWADRPTLRALRYLARHPALDATVIIATVRDDDIDGPRAEEIEHLARKSQRVDLRLSGFDDHEVRALIRAAAPPETLSTLVDQSPLLHDVTGGNPFFLRELLREIDEEGTKLDDASVVQTLSTVAPVGVRSLVERRLARLTPDAREIVEAASVLGHSVDVATLARVCELTPEPALEGLEEALAARLLVEDAQPIDRFWFSHALVRNAIYAHIPPPRRRDLHRRVAEALAAESPSPVTSRCAEIAHHYYEAAPLGYHAEAAIHAARAGDEAVERAAFGEAARWYGQALECHQAVGTPADALGRLHFALGRALLNDKQNAAAQAALGMAADCARASSDDALLAEVALTADNPWALGADYQPHVLALLEEALDRIGESDLQLRVRLLAAIATNLYYVDVEREGEMAWSALAFAERVGSATEVATAHRALHLWYSHRPEARAERLAACRHAYALARAAGDGSARCRLATHRSLAVDLLENQEISEFERTLDGYERLAEELGSPGDIYWTMAFRAMQATMHGDLTAADQLARGALLRGHELDQISDGAYFLQRFVIRYAQGRLAEEIPALAEAGQFETVYRAGAALHAVGLCETGRGEKALQIVRRVLGPDASGLRKDAFWLAGLSLFAGVVSAARDLAMAEVLLPLIEPCADHVVLFGAGAAMLGSGRHWLAGLHAALGHSDAALDHYREAVRIAERLRAPYWAAQAQIDAAALAVGSHARQLRDDAVRVAESQGYGRILRQAATLQLD